MVDQEIARLKAIDDERERVHKKKMKGTVTYPFAKWDFLVTFRFLGFLNKAEKKGEALFDQSTEPTAIKSGFIEEVKE